LARIGAVAVLTGIVLVSLALRYGGETLVVPRHLEAPDGIVVLASHEWERLPVAAQLARQYPAARLLLTLPAEVTDHNCFECAERLRWLSDAGIGRERVTVLPRLVTNTYDEARATADFVSHHHRIDRLVIVTSPYHGRRALATFRHLFRSAGVPTDLGLASQVSVADPSRWWLRRYDREYVAYEWTGIVYYAVRFGILPTV
jgi:uncharacterized SAM-binding protein YcdF (DUF218 family)